MTTELAPNNLVEFSPTGLSFRNDLDVTEWLQVGEGLGRFEKCRLWAWGDWLCYGERRYGEKYAQAVDASDYQYNTLKNAMYVSKNVRKEVRRPELSWNHHFQVARLPTADQPEALAIAVEDNLTVKQTKEMVDAMMGKAPKEERESIDYWTWFERQMRELGRAKVFEMGADKFGEMAWNAGRENK